MFCVFLRLALRGGARMTAQRFADVCPVALLREGLCDRVAARVRLAFLGEKGERPLTVGVGPQRGAFGDDATQEDRAGNSPGARGFDLGAN